MEEVQYTRPSAPMKFTSSQLAYLVGDREARGNLRALLKYILTLVALITIYAILFHIIKVQVEGEQHSWITGFYWTLVVMTTLGFGDITFTSDIGRLFSIVVLLSGVVLLLVMLPFMFISLFYAPWLEARVRLRAPREVPERHARPRDPHRVRPDRRQPDRAAAHRAHPVLRHRAGSDGGGADGRRRHVGHRRRERQQRHLSRGQRAQRPACCWPTAKTRSTPTSRSPRARSRPSCRSRRSSKRRTRSTSCELSGATHVLPLKRQLGEYLANRADTGDNDAHVIGDYRGLQIAELPARDTTLAGQTVRDTRLRERTGVSVVGMWDRGKLRPAFPDSIIQSDGVIVLAGTEAQVAALNALTPRTARAPLPVLIIGAGKVGIAAARALMRKGARVHAIDRSSAGARTDGRRRRPRSSPATPRTGRLLEQAGIHDASSVLLTTNDDAMNIYLAVYCRRLNPSLRIVSRITHERNVEAIHRAGADFAISYTTLGVEAVMSLLRGYQLVVLGEGVELFSITVPGALQRQAPGRLGHRICHRHERRGPGPRRHAGDAADGRNAARRRRRAADARQPRAAQEVRGEVREGASEMPAS